MESYAHKAAKATVMEWLHYYEDRMGDIYARGLDTAWFADDNGRHFWSEYPVMSDGTGFNPTWPRHGMTEPPTFESLKLDGEYPAVVFDVAIADCGYIRTGIEIVHKHPPSVKKLVFLKSMGLTELLIIPARWVLGQIAAPNVVPADFWAWR